MKDHPDWKRNQRRQDNHLAVQAEAGSKFAVISVANRGTEREQKVTVCRGYCHTCGLHLNDILWRYWSPLNRTEEKMPLIADRQETAAPG